MIDDPRTFEVIAACVADTERRLADWRAKECTPASRSARDKKRAAAMTAHFADRETVCTGGRSYGTDIVVSVTKIDPYGKIEGRGSDYIYQPGPTGAYNFAYNR